MKELGTRNSEVNCIGIFHVRNQVELPGTSRIINRKKSNMVGDQEKAEKIFSETKPLVTYLHDDISCSCVSICYYFMCRSIYFVHSFASCYGSVLLAPEFSCLLIIS